MWVKICANTNLDDALQAAESGADAVGFVFAASKRQVTAEQAGAIIAKLPASVEKVGVFAKEPAESIAEKARIAGLTSIQLHGGLDLQLVEKLQPLVGSGVRIIHTAHWVIGVDEASSEQVRWTIDQLAGLDRQERLLVDAKFAGASGGLGLAYDWTAAARVFTEARDVRMIVAGGLRPETVHEAVLTLRPYGVDVASGVERVPGIKDHAKVTDFIKNARTAG